MRNFVLSEICGNLYLSNTRFSAAKKFMFPALIFITFIGIGGFALTYLFADEESFLWRVCAGNIIGSAVFGLIVFLLACFFGLTTATVILSFLSVLAPLILFADKARRARLNDDWQATKRNLEGADFGKLSRVAYYLFFFALFYFFFDRAMLETAQGIFTGASNNLGDLPFHLGAIFSFTDGQNFPPENPSYAFAKFSYPFIADLIVAAFVKIGANVRGAMLVQNVSLAFSLLVVLERFTYKLTGSRLAGKIAPALLFFSGGLGFLWFLKDYWQGAKGFFDFIWNLPFDYTIGGEKFSWGNSLIVLFITQRSLLLGMPLTIIVLQKLWEKFDNGEWLMVNGKSDEKTKINHLPFTIYHSLSLGLLAGTLPLIHVHSLAVLFVVVAVLIVFRLDKWREWIWFGIGVAIVAVPELIWAMTGSATRLTEFIAWNFGWTKKAENFFWFWLKNTGAFIPVLIFALVAAYSSAARKEKSEAKSEDDERRIEENISPSKESKLTDNSINNLPFTINHLVFYVPFLLCFLIPNLVKLAPWEWDNIKVLIYWFVGSIPFVAFIIARLREKELILKIVAFALFFVLIFAGALDVWRVVSKQINYKVFDKDAIALSEQIKQKIAPNALFLNAPTYNSAVVLSGRRSLMRYSGHLSSYGIDYAGRESDVKRIYTGDATADLLLKKYNIEYVLISPEEKSNLSVNEDFFGKFPVVAEAGQYRVYQVIK